MAPTRIYTKTHTHQNRYYLGPTKNLNWQVSEAIKKKYLLRQVEN